MSLTIYLFFFVFLHACSARSLGFVDKGTVKFLQLPEKKVEPLSAQRLIDVQEKLRAEVETRIVKPPNSDGANTMQPKNPRASEKEKKDNKGDNVLSPLMEEVLQETAKLEGQKRQAARLMIESSPKPNNAEETMDSKENVMGEDIVVMDYAQPHRKPPIHNKEP